LQMALVPVLVRGHASLLTFLLLAVPGGAALVAIGVGLAKAHARRGPLRTYPEVAVGRLIAGLAFLSWATVVGFVALVLGALRCDEACSADGDWTTDAHAFQWGVIGVLGPVVFALAVAAVVTRLAGRPQAAQILFGLQAAAMATLALTGTIGGSPGGSVEVLVLATITAQAL